MDLPVNNLQKEYWNNNFRKTSLENAAFFKWYDEKRIETFGFLPRKGLFLEIGPGSGEFSRLADISMVVDISWESVKRATKQNRCRGVVANASQLPFKEGTFDAVFANDVMHHLKAENILEPACQEIRRVLKVGGKLLVSDRRPSYSMSLMLALNRAGRFVYGAVAKFSSRNPMMSGSEDEPPMTKLDFQIILGKPHMRMLAQNRWKSWVVFWAFASQQFINLLLPPSISLKLAFLLLQLCKMSENIPVNSLKTDTCITMEKIQ